MKLDFYLFNTLLVNPPRNFREIEFELSYENAQPSATLKTTKYEFDLENATLINNYVKQGLTGGAGIFEGIPFKIVGCTNVTLFSGELVLTDSSVLYECDIVTVSVRETGKIDFMNDRASSFSFAYLASLPSNQAGAISYSDYIDIPYVISEIPDYSQAFAISMMLFMLAKEIYELTKNIASLVAELAGVYTTIPAIVKLALELAYLILLVIALIKLIQSLIDELIQPLKYKKGIRVKTLFEKGCAYLGYTLSSSILQSSVFKDLVLIPRKAVTPNANLFKYRKTADEQNNQAATGYYEGTFSDLIQDINKVVDGQVRVFNGVVYYESYRQFNVMSSYVMPATRTDNMNFTAPDPHGTNASEIFSNTLVEWSLDDTDLNTYNELTGTNAQMIMTPTVVNNPKNILLTGLNNVQIPFALGKRKETFTRIENIVNILISGFVNPLLAAIDVVIGGNHQIPFLTNRIGALLLSNDFTGIPKLVVIDSGNHLSPNNKLWTSAAYLMATYHKNRFALKVNNVTIPFDTGNITFNQPGNQYLTYKNSPVPLCCQDFVKLANTNELTTDDQKVGLADAVSWNPFKEQGRIDYRIREDYTKNITQKFVVDGKA